MTRGECEEAARIADRMLAVADQSGSEVQHDERPDVGDHRQAPSRRAGARAGARATRASAWQRAPIRLHDSPPSSIQSSRAGVVLGRNLWMLGDTRGSREQVQGAVALAREIGHPNSLAFALMFHGWIHGYFEDWETCLRSSAEGIAFSSEHGLVQTKAWLQCVHGWGLAQSGKITDGLVELQSAIEDSRSDHGTGRDAELHRDARGGSSPSRRARTRARRDRANSRGDRNHPRDVLSTRSSIAWRPTAISRSANQMPPNTR